MRRVEVRRGGARPAEDLEEAIVWGDRPEEVGCVVAFIGVVRGLNRSGARVSELVVEGDEAEVRRELEELASRALSVRGVKGVHISVSLGRLRVGDEITRIVVAAWGKDEAFKATRMLIDAIKASPKIRVREVLEEGGDSKQAYQDA